MLGPYRPKVRILCTLLHLIAASAVMLRCRGSRRVAPRVLSYGGRGALARLKGGTECRISNKECRISKGMQAAFPSKFDIPCSIFCGSVLHYCVGDTKGRSPLPGRPKG